MLYTLLIYSPHAAPPAPDDEAGILDRHRALQSETRDAGALRAVVRLEPTARARTVHRPGDLPLVTDGPFAETKEWLAGFYLVDCADEAEAIRHAETICCRPGDRIELRPVRWSGA